MIQVFEEDTDAHTSNTLYSVSENMNRSRAVSESSSENKNCIQDRHFKTYKLEDNLSNKPTVLKMSPVEPN